MEQSVCSDVKRTACFLLHGLCSERELYKYKACITQVHICRQVRYDLPSTHVVSCGRNTAFVLQFFFEHTCLSNLLSIFFLNIFVLSRSAQNIFLTAIICRSLSHFERNPGVACILTLLATPTAYPRPLLAWFPIRRSCKQEASCTKKWRTRVSHATASSRGVCAEHGGSGRRRSAARRPCPRAQAHDVLLAAWLRSNVFSSRLQRVPPVRRVGCVATQVVHGGVRVSD